MSENFNNQDSAKKEVGVLLDTLISHGLKEIVCSPGSRNTPLLIAVSVRREIKTTVVADERTAAFVALGKSIVSRKPVGLICTSGSAMLNYAPALAEAYYQNIPLVAITADRPMEWIDQDDSQTLRQQDAFKNFVKCSYDIISGREDPDFLWYVNRITNEGMLRATEIPSGPVHFNVRLDNPLSVTMPINENRIRKVSVLSAHTIPKNELTKLAESAVGKKILIVAGFNAPDHKLDKSVRKLLCLPNVSLMAETISNLHVNSEYNMVDSVLCHMNKSEKDSLRPDIVISLGGAIVSRMLKDWLRTYTPNAHWSLSSNDILADCYKCVTMKIKSHPHLFLSSLSGALAKLQKSCQSIPQYANAIKCKRESASLINNKFLMNVPWCDMRAYNAILKAIPENSNLFLSNGTTIRYAQILSGNNPHASYCNRGVSGIDGCSSTAIGGSTIYDEMTILLSGDMSFAYDLGALGCRLADKKMRIIVINNGGGGIFRFISTTKDLPQLEEYFCANPNPPVKGLADAYGWDYFKADSESSLLSLLPQFLSENSSPAILEVITPPSLSAEILSKFLKPSED